MALLHDLERDDWTRATACTGWTVHDVALHLAGGLLANVSRRRDGHHGNLSEFSPPGVLPGEDSWLVHTLNAWNESWVLAARRVSPALTIEIIDLAGAELETFFGTLDLDQLGDSVGWAGPGSSPVWLDVAREYTEIWTHAAQIREATSRPLVDDPDLFMPVMETFAHGVPYALRDIDRSEGTSLRVVLTGDGGGEWWAVRAASGWRLARPGEGLADASVWIDAVMAWRLATKGIEPGTAKAAARVEGDAGLADGFFNLVAILA